MEEDVADVVGVFPSWRAYFLDGTADMSLGARLEDIARRGAREEPRWLEECGMGRYRLTEEGRRSVEGDESTYAWLLELEVVAGEDGEEDGMDVG
jgi:hypothetical protein